jgi:RNA polymerase sigma-70 factor (ECF subfamily)
MAKVSPPSGEITRLLGGLRQGDPRAWDRLMPIVYDELRRQASAYLRKERPGHVLQTTALVHESYLRLVGESDRSWQNRAHFFAIAANLMRQILVDHARRRNAARRGGDPVMAPLEAAQFGNVSDPVPLDQLDEALNRLEAIRPRHGRIVELRFFGGLTTEEVAEALGVSARTVEREWAFAKAWLFGQLSR